MSARAKPSPPRRPESAPSHSALWSRPGYLIRRLHQIHVAIFMEECAEFALTPVQYGLMTTLLDQPGLDQITLGAELGIDRTNVADVLGRLEVRGLVRRQVSRTDRRMKLAYLTPDGLALTRRMEANMSRAQGRLMAPLEAEERAHFIDLLRRLVDANNEWGRAPLRID